MTPISGLDPISLALALMLLAVLPFAAMIVTSYTKVVVVLGLLRNALGVQQVPPNMVLNGIAIIISVYVMAPVAMEASDRMQMLPPSAQSSNTQQMLAAASAAREPFRKFLDKHADAAEKAFFLKSAQALWPEDRARSLQADDLVVLAPAFLLTELTAAFRIGFLLYLAFIIVELVIANVLLAMGLSQVSPTNVAIPFKLLLFVVLDGWSQVMHGLVMTYR
ncbi:EscR/YscR/HrcR family type III secretion system export apparatus protein [Paracidovorax avenae]|uniref:Yop virulence translocation R n=2 Tax=Paracidovorax avenae TaxID=80867 RepID=F0Q5D9_PARA1|nr:MULTISPECIES: type III secretion system export apparatus subunit SctR [Comamonadaceae]ADX44438.1 Yop virulence translocation R [Paracidovorax avenae ATCC 19860]AVS64896.1 EscR/YscR/HrcR family type III secretion system export apparatus protein [Paracidovorax avenae]AVS69345.1 EscR/YscR/HrcR family type III secretion system export apparatus protein [Paracidovorax avenae]AVS76816.1 EscR/YscR/HrcR family type III secretion system export apparatus protein [Paracidovorax avenae]AVS80037.1 EscR/Y